jgi:hypothetical protein
MTETTPPIAYRSIDRTPEFSLMQFCQVCTRRFFVREHDEGRIPNCSKRCDRKHHRMRLLEERKMAVTKVEAHAPLTPYESSRLRSHIFSCVAEQIERAHAFVMERPLDPDDPAAAPPKMNAQQVRVFTALLNKVVPDLSHTFTESADHKRDLAELTREELEAIVASAKIIEGTASTSDEADPDDPDPGDPDP